MTFSFKFLLLMSFITSNTFASTPVKAPSPKILIMSSHPQVTKLIKELIAENNLETKIEVETPITFNGDPHHFSPTPLEIKKFIGADLLVSAPLGLTPWMKSILTKREAQKNAKTILLNIDEEFTKKYLVPNKKEKSIKHAISHFWPYPDIYCALKKSLFEEFQKIHPEIKLSTNKCAPLDNYLKLSSSLNDLAKSNQFQNTLIILSHDALIPLLHHLGFNVLALKGSHDHEEVSTKSLKLIEEALNNNSSKKIIWILEDNIKFPKQIQDKYFYNKTKLSEIIHLDLENYNLHSNDKEKNKYPTILEELLDKLKNKNK